MDLYAEIKFRVYRNLEKMYSTGRSGVNIGAISSQSSYGKTPCLYGTIPYSSNFILEPFLGIYDMNGNEIYVNDVLAQTHRTPVHLWDDESIANVRKAELVVKEEKDTDDGDVLRVLTGAYATPQRYPRKTWLQGEKEGCFGNGEDEPENWIKVGTIHDERFKGIDFTKFYIDVKQKEAFDEALGF